MTQFAIIAPLVKPRHLGSSSLGDGSGGDIGAGGGSTAVSGGGRALQTTGHTLGIAALLVEPRVRRSRAPHEGVNRQQLVELLEQTL